MDRLHVDPGEGSYVLESPTHRSSVRGDGTVVFEAAEGAVRAAFRGEEFAATTCWRLRLEGGPPYGGATVRDVRAGRGFHWEKRINQRIPGVLEAASVDGHIMLVAEMDVETYLLGVITAEMGGGCPPAFLQAQTVTARSWLLAQSEGKHQELGIDYCNDDCCQRFQGLGAVSEAARQAVEATKGEVLMTEGRIVDANYSKNCGGISESPEAVWGFHKPGQCAAVDAPGASAAHRFFPVSEANLHEYLCGEWLDQTDLYCSPRRVLDAELPQFLGRVDDGKGYFRWRQAYTCDEVEGLLNRDSVGLQEGVSRLLDLRVTRRGVSGRAIEVLVIYQAAGGDRCEAALESEFRIRAALHPSFLYSSAFEIQVERSANGDLGRIELVGAGWGHGAGLCQIGALGRALAGHDCQDIVGHYFRGAVLREVY